jgi:hypothetical protein
VTDERQSSGLGRAEDQVAAIDRLAHELEGIGRRESGPAVEFVRGGIVFAVREGGGHSFRLRPEIVLAALQTPDTFPSERGAEWVALASTAADAFTLDRARAWFETAWRLAGEAVERRPRMN